jgi:hypothetical protein
VVPDIDDNAAAVDEEADDDDCSHEVWQVHVLAETEAAEIAYNLDDIKYDVEEVKSHN